MFSVLLKKAQNVMDIGERLRVKFYGEKSFNLMKIIELEDHNYAEKEKRDLDVLMEGNFVELGDGTSLLNQKKNIVVRNL